METTRFPTLTSLLEGKPNGNQMLPYDDIPKCVFLQMVHATKLFPYVVSLPTNKIGVATSRSLTMPSNKARCNIPGYQHNIHPLSEVSLGKANTRWYTVATGRLGPLGKYLGAQSRTSVFGRWYRPF